MRHVMMTNSGIGVVSPVLYCLQYPWGYSVSMRQIISTREAYSQHPWGYSVTVRKIISTCETYLQYPWGYLVPMRKIISTREAYSQHPWGYSLTVRKIISTRETYHQYPWGYAVTVRKVSSTFEWISSVPMKVFSTQWKRMKFPSRLLHILTGTDDFPHGYWISSWVLRILEGNEDSFYLAFNFWLNLIVPNFNTCEDDNPFVIISSYFWNSIIITQCLPCSYILSLIYFME